MIQSELEGITTDAKRGKMRASESRLAFGFNSNWMKKWPQFLSVSCSEGRQNQLPFNTRMKTALSTGLKLLLETCCVRKQDLLQCKYMSHQHWLAFRIVRSLKLRKIFPGLFWFDITTTLCFIQTSILFWWNESNHFILTVSFNAWIRKSCRPLNASH